MHRTIRHNASHPFPDEKLLHDVATGAAAYFSQLPERRVAPLPSDLAPLVAQLGTPLPTQGCSPAAVVEELDRLVAPATVATAGPRYFGFVTGGALPATVAASWLASTWDQNAFSHASSPAGVVIEQLALAWLSDFLAMPAGCGAALTTGATIANFTALAAARRAALKGLGWDVEERGLYGAPEVTVAVSEQAHPTVRKALGLLGLGRDRVRVLATDVQGRIRADSLPALRGPVIVCAQAGNVNSGAFDPFVSLRAWCDEMDAWLHIDGAFGLWAMASPERRELAAGVEAADSWATDAHKWLNVPYDSGLAFVRDARALRQAMSFSAPYLPADAPREPFHTTAEASRRARGIEIWAALRSLGRTGVAELVDGCCRRAARFADALRALGYELLNEVVLNQVVVSFGSDAQNEQVIERIQAEGVCWCGPTSWRGRRAMRISVSSWATRDEDVERSLASIARCAATTLGTAG